MFEDFPDMRSLDDYARHIAGIMTHWTGKKDFTSSGRTLYWDKSTGTIVWRDPGTRDGGSAFRPKNPKQYFDRHDKWVTMNIKNVTKHKATVWFSRDELGFMIAATERALKEIDPEYFRTRTGRTTDYANAVVARLRVANGDTERRMPLLQSDDRARGVAYDPRAPSSQHVVMTVDVVAEDGALVSLSDHELRFLNNAINEAVNGLRENKEFELATGKSGEYTDRLMDQLIDANDKIEALN